MLLDVLVGKTLLKQVAILRVKRLITLTLTHLLTFTYVFMRFDVQKLNLKEIPVSIVHCSTPLAINVSLFCYLSSPSLPLLSVLLSV